MAKRYVPYYGANGGITFSGGEPLLQGEFLIETMKLLKKEGINSIIDTSGTHYDEYTDEVIENCQMVLLDVKSSNEKMFQEITAKKIETLFKVIGAINSNNKHIWVRQVIVPGINDTEENICNLYEFIKRIKFIDRVELLGYHSMGKSKWEKLGIKYQLEGLAPMDASRLRSLQELIEKVEITA